eukprot:scaffold9103_cov124-Skeletonema_dohrnii-CCMP3373.AAC.1
MAMTMMSFPHPITPSYSDDTTITICLQLYFGYGPTAIAVDREAILVASVEVGWRHTNSYIPLSAATQFCLFVVESNR